MFSKKAPKQRIFVPKSSGLGWGLNPNHPLSWMAAFGLLVLVIYLTIR
ncbi:MULTISPECIES: DUF5808 domain-containing protein [Paenibacillus]|nr:DUF5808 domain-containing protein [Paenibacillus borealis]